MSARWLLAAATALVLALACGSKQAAAPAPAELSNESSGDMSEPAEDDPAGDPYAGECMDEVGCLLAEHPPYCCERYKNKKR